MLYHLVIKPMLYWRIEYTLMIAMNALTHTILFSTVNR